jgi:drug/metabolite transporter (DMT)-like permease
LASLPLPDSPSANKTTISIFSGYPQRGFYMRVVQILGALLIAGGLFILIKSPSYSSEKSLIKIGDVEAKVAEQHLIPPWAGGAALAAGVILIVVGARRR